MAVYFVNTSETNLNFGDVAIPLDSCILGTTRLTKQVLALLKHAKLRGDIKEYSEIPPGVKLIKGFVSIPFEPPKLDLADIDESDEPQLDRVEEEVLDLVEEPEPEEKKKPAKRKAGGGRKKKAPSPE